MKKRSEETQTLRAGCSKAEPRIISPWKRSEKQLYPGCKGKVWTLDKALAAKLSTLYNI